MVSPPAQRGVSSLPGCGFCRRNREPIEVCRSHRIKDQHGNITCPQLAKYTCDLCGATGPRAHTRSYCPQLPINRDRQQHQQQRPMLQDDLTRTSTSTSTRGQQQRPPPKLQYEAELERELDQLIPRQQPLPQLLPQLQLLQQHQHQFNQILWQQPEQLEYNFSEDQLFSNINNNHYGYIDHHNGRQQNGNWRVASYEQYPLMQQEPLFLPTTTIGPQQQHQALGQPPIGTGAAASAYSEPPSLHLSQAGVRNMGRVTNSRYNSAGKLRRTVNNACGGRPDRHNHNYNGRSHQ